MVDNYLAMSRDGVDGITRPRALGLVQRDRRYVVVGHHLKTLIQICIYRQNKSHVK